MVQLDNFCKSYFLLFGDILYLEGQGNDTQIYLKNGCKVLVPYTLKRFDRHLETCNDYIRAHKSFLVNLQSVKSVAWKGEQAMMTLTNNDCIGIARRKRSQVRKRLKALKKATIL